MPDAPQLLEKAKNTYLEFRHADGVPKFELAKRFMARLMRPVTRLLYEVVQDYEATVAKVDLLTTGQADLRRRVESYVPPTTTTATTDAKTAIQQFDPEWARFYHEFENQFRGSFDLILRRTGDRYLKRLTDLATTRTSKAPPLAVDVGCGRGEFLELCRGNGFQCQGADISPAAVAASKARKLDVVQKDGLSFLRTLAPSSVAVIGSFHMVEHCPPRYVLDLFKEAMRVLEPGGVFVVETPNGHSLWAQTHFHLDPTHVAPMHPKYLDFLGNYVGFGRTEILLFSTPEGPDIARLDESPELKKFAAWAYAPEDLAAWCVKGTNHQKN